MKKPTPGPEDLPLDSGKRVNPERPPFTKEDPDGLDEEKRPTESAAQSLAISTCGPGSGPKNGVQ